MPAHDGFIVPHIYWYDEDTMLTKRRRAVWRRREFLVGLGLCVLVLSTLFFVLPSFVVWQQTNQNAQPPFPLGVDPVHKTITENQAAAILFSNQDTPVAAAVAGAGNFFDKLSQVIARSGLYQTVAAAGDVPQVVTIDPGLRKEQVAALFANALGWDANTEKMFLELPPISNEDLNDGTITPDDYAVSNDTSVVAVQTEIKNQFENTILSRYTPAIQKVVPLNEGLTIASIIERETSDPTEMRIISGIIWNRIFDGMKLQMDSTLQYAKAPSKGAWWPPVLPADKYIDSPYNTYENLGLPPAPIAEPSVAAVLAALNPVNTSCLYYFHDSNGVFHCSDTYAGQVALLKKYYGQGK